MKPISSARTYKRIRINGKTKLAHRHIKEGENMNDNVQVSYHIERVWLPRDPANVKATKSGHKPAFYFTLRYGAFLVRCITVWKDEDGKFYVSQPAAHSIMGRKQYPIKVDGYFMAELTVKVAEINPLGISSIDFLNQTRAMAKGNGKDQLLNTIKGTSIAF